MKIFMHSLHKHFDSYWIVNLCHTTFVRYENLKTFSNRFFFFIKCQSFFDDHFTSIDGSTSKIFALLFHKTIFEVTRSRTFEIFLKIPKAKSKFLLSLFLWSYVFHTCFRCIPVNIYNMREVLSRLSFLGIDLHWNINQTYTSQEFLQNKTTNWFWSFVSLIFTCHFTIISPRTRSTKTNGFVWTIGITNRTDTVVFTKNIFTKSFV